MTVTMDTSRTEQVSPAAAPSPVPAPTEVTSPAPRPAPARPRRVPRVRPVLTARITRVTAAVLSAAFVVMGSIQPAPDGSDPALPWWASMLGWLSVVMVLATLLALIVGRRAGLWGGVVSGAGLTAMTLSCPAVDHHGVAGWWWGSLALSVAFGVVSLGVLAATAPAQRG